MIDCLLDRFFAYQVDEDDGYVRTVLVEAIEAGPPSDTQYFTFNVFDVLLDFDTRTVTVMDVLDGRAECRIAMDSLFRRLRESAGDDNTLT